MLSAEWLVPIWSEDFIVKKLAICKPFAFCLLPTGPSSFTAFSPQDDNFYFLALMINTKNRLLIVCRENKRR